MKNRRKKLQAKGNAEGFAGFVKDAYPKVKEYIRHFFIVMRKDVPRGRNGKKLRPKKAACGQLFLLPLFFVYCEILLRAFGTGSFFHNLFYPIVFALSSGFFISAILMLFKPKINITATRVIMILMAVISVAEILVKQTFKSYLTPAAMIAKSKAVANNYLGDAITVILSGFFILVLYALPIVLYFLFGKKYLRAHQYKWQASAVFFVVCFFLLGIGTLTAATGPAGSKYSRQYTFAGAVENFGLGTALRLNVAYSGRNSTLIIEDETEDETTTDENQTEQAVDYGYNQMDIDFAALAASESDATYKELDEYVNSLQASKKNKYTGIFKGKNLIMICAEAYCPAFVSEELTPTLYRMIHNGFYFSDYYQPTWGGSTSTGEYSMITGLIPTDGLDSMQQTIGHNMYFTMGNQLQRLGYFSEAYHPGDYDFYDRYLTHENLGYSKFLAYGNGLEDITGEWTGDQICFDLTMDGYTSKQPFSIYYMSISGHCTYDADNNKVAEYWDRVDSVVGTNFMDVTKYYICYQMQFEDALKTMIEKLEKAGIADDTVICITGDHYPYGLDYETFGNTQDYVADLFGGDHSTHWTNDVNSLIIWSGSLENELKDYQCEISTPCYSLDIVPTLSNLFGVEYDSRLLVGRDALSDTDPLVLWPDYSWKTDKGTYDAGTQTFTANAENPPEDEAAYVEKINTKVTNKFSFSSNVLHSDYYRALFGDDTDN